MDAECMSGGEAIDVHRKRELSRKDGIMQVSM